MGGALFPCGRRLSLPRFWSHPAQDFCFFPFVSRFLPSSWKNRVSLRRGSGAVFHGRRIAGGNPSTHIPSGYVLRAARCFPREKKGTASMGLLSWLRKLRGKESKIFLRSPLRALQLTPQRSPGKLAVGFRRGL